MRAAGYRGPNVFSPEAIRLVARVSEGLTRRINILADKALLAAFASGSHAVTRSEVRRAVRDSAFRRSTRGLQKMGIGALTAGLALGWGVHALWSGGDSAKSADFRAGPSQAAPRAGTATPSGKPTLEQSAPLASVAKAQPSPPTTPAAGTPGQERPAPPQYGELTRKRFAATQEWLQKAPGNHYAIQLATASSNEVGYLEDFLLKASKVVPVEELFVYGVKIGGQQYYRAAYGSYAGPAEVLAAMKGLPPLLAAQHPYYRSVERMRSQNRQ